LNISLFERLINNNYPNVTLNYQRRMKTEIADFTRLVYGSDKYIDHQSVEFKNKKKLYGLWSDIFFINHT
jgi:hypothetical protein